MRCRDSYAEYAEELASRCPSVESDYQASTEASPITSQEIEEKASTSGRGLVRNLRGMVLDCATMWPVARQVA